MDPFERAVRETLIRRALLQRREPAVVALSGGPDSTALVAALSALGHPVRALHINHALRGAESDRDEAAAAATARALGIAFDAVRLSPPDSGRSPENWARGERLAACREAALRHGIAAIAVGHTRNDQAETVLYRAARGAGPRGLRGILPSLALRDGRRIIRPLIDRSRAEVEEYVIRRALSPVSDTSNDDLRLARNRLRHETLPSLERARPGAARALARLADLSARLHGWIAAEGIRAGASCSLPSGAIDAASLSALPPFLAAAVLEAGAPGIPRFDAAGIDRLGAFLAGGQAPELRLRRGWVLVRQAAALRLYPPPPPPDWRSPLSAQVRVAGLRITAREVHADREFLPRFLAARAQWEEAIDAETLLSGGVLRTRRAGDRFLPLGAPGERKLQDFLTDLKLPRAERARTVVLEARARWGEEAIVWIAGRRIDHRARVQPETRRVLILSAEPAATS